MHLEKIALSILGRQMGYRIGRALYQRARCDGPNSMELNGEMLVLECVLDAWGKYGFIGQRLAIFDVGANVGDWSAALVSMFSESPRRDTIDLYIFEPVPSTFELLRNRLGTLSPVLHYEQVALSSESGRGKMYVGRESGINSLHANPLREEEEQVEIVKISAADFCGINNVKKVQLLKCDTEGHDMEVIQGALPLLAEERISVLQFEYNYRWVFSRHFLRDVFMAIEKLPYKLVKLQSDHLLILDEWHPELERFFECNYAIVHVDSLDWFPTKRASWDNYNAMYIADK